MIVATGINSQIIKELRELLPDEEFVRLGPYTIPSILRAADKYIFCAGILHGKNALDHWRDEDSLEETMVVNLLSPIVAIDKIIETKDDARICVIGSESGISGSYDPVYSAAKRQLHHYIETKRLRTPQQQLVGIAPSIICDAGMTLRRTDKDRLEERATSHPKKRFMLSNEVARLIKFLLYEDRGYITGTVIRMNGGEHTK